MTEEYDKYQEEMDVYGTPDSVLLKMVREAGFKPIGITLMMCEETFIFKGNKEAKEAWEMFSPEGWWYGLASFWKEWDDYHKQMGNYDHEEVDSAIHWLDKNFEPKK